MLARRSRAYLEEVIIQGECIDDKGWR
jgi:hypothetical protein